MKKHAFNASEWDLIKRYLVGGLQVGAGVGVLQAGGNYLHDLGKEIQDKPSEDDDTLYVQMPKRAMMATGVGMTGGVLSLVTANAVVRKLFQAAKRKRVQDELDQAQMANLATVQKTAAEGHRSLGPTEAAGGGMVALALLSALASGAVTYSSLNKAFPQVRKPANPLPKRVKILPAPADAPAEKLAAAGDASTAVEFLLRMALATKQARDGSELPDLVAAVAQGRIDELAAVCREHGADAMFEVTKGAATVRGGPVSYDLAITMLSKSAMLSPLVRDYSQAEIFEAYPTVAAAGAALADTPTGDLLVKFARCAGLMLRVQHVLLPLQDGMQLTDAKQARTANIEAAIRSALARENQDVTTDPQTVKEHLYKGELLSGISGETVDDVDQRDSNVDERRRQPEEKLEELVMGL